MKGIFDIHCHILPGVDDGAASMDETLRLLALEYEDGVRSIIFTPHFRRRMFEPDMELVREAFWQTREEAAKIYPDLNLYLGCEFHANSEMQDILKRGERPTMAGSKYVLTEFKESAEYGYVRERIQTLRTRGFRPIIAHAERVACLKKDAAGIAELVEAGARIQINAESILGQEGFTVKRLCKKLMKLDLIHFVGTDAHNTRDRVPNMGKCAAYIEKKMGTAYAEKLLIENPGKIIQEGNRTDEPGSTVY